MSFTGIIAKKYQIVSEDHKLQELYNHNEKIISEKWPKGSPNKTKGIDYYALKAWVNQNIKLSGLQDYDFVGFIMKRRFLHDSVSHAEKHLNVQ